MKPGAGRRDLIVISSTSHTSEDSMWSAIDRAHDPSRREVYHARQAHPALPSPDVSDVPDIDTVDLYRARAEGTLEEVSRLGGLGVGDRHALPATDEPAIGHDPRYPPLFGFDAMTLASAVPEGGPEPAQEPPRRLFTQTRGRQDADGPFSYGTAYQ
jgi:hypothetical protein